MAITDGRFKFAVDYIIQNEGSEFTNDPDDPGSATKFGITIQTLRDYRNDQWLTPEDVEDLTYEEAVRLYHDVYWVGRFDSMQNMRVAAKCMDIFVNIRPKAAVRLMQRAVNRFEVVKIKEDGIWGPQTKTAINIQSPNNYMLELVQLLQEYYYDIVKARPRSQKFLKGWLNRAKRLPSAVMFKQ